MAEVTETKQAETRETTDTVKNEEELGQAQTPNLPEEEKDEALKAASEEKEVGEKESAPSEEALSPDEYDKRYYSGYFYLAVEDLKKYGNLDNLYNDINGGKVNPVDKYDERLGIKIENVNNLQKLVDLVPMVAQRLLRQKLLERYQEKIGAGAEPTVWDKGEKVKLRNEVSDNAVNFIKVNLNDCLTSEDLQVFLQEKKVGLTHGEYFNKVGEIFKTTRAKVEDKKFEEEANILMVKENGKWVETLTPEAKQAVQAEAIGYLQDSFPQFLGLLENEFSIKKDK